MFKTRRIRFWLALILALTMLVPACVPPTMSTAAPATKLTATPEAATQPPPLIMSFDQINGEGKVTFELPWQGRSMAFAVMDFNRDIASPTPTPKDYKILRPVIYVQVKSEGGVVHHFDPPLKMIIDYTSDDWEKAGENASNLVVLILNYDKNEWDVYTPAIEPKNKDNPKLGGTGTIFISNWTSHACWGRT